MGKPEGPGPDASLPSRCAGPVMSGALPTKGLSLRSGQAASRQQGGQEGPEARSEPAHLSELCVLGRWGPALGHLPSLGGAAFSAVYDIGWVPEPQFPSPGSFSAEYRWPTPKRGAPHSRIQEQAPIHRTPVGTREGLSCRDQARRRAVTSAGGAGPAPLPAWTGLTARNPWGPGGGQAERGVNCVIEAQGFAKTAWKSCAQGSGSSPRPAPIRDLCREGTDPLRNPRASKSAWALHPSATAAGQG